MSTSETSSSRTTSTGISCIPYISLYTGRGCRSKCTFCLWPQTIGGHRYRTRSAENVAGEIRRATELFPQVKEYFFDDDTFTDDLPRDRAGSPRCLGKIGVTWSCNAKPMVPYETLKVMKDNGLRLLLVGYESGNQQILNNIRKGTRVDVARRFTEDCHRLGILDPRHLHRGPAGRNTRDDREHDPVRPRDEPAHDPGLPPGALPRHGALQPGRRKGLARRRTSWWPTTGSRWRG